MDLLSKTMDSQIESNGLLNTPHQSTYERLDLTNETIDFPKNTMKFIKT